MNTMAEELWGNISRRRGGRREVPVFLQMEATECGAACLGMILAHYGRWVPLEELRVRCGVSRNGSKAASMLRAAREYGLIARGFRREPKMISDLPFPMIVYWRFNHFIVVEGVKGKYVYVVDPSEGPRRITDVEFDEGFTGVCLAFAPDPAFRRGGSRPSVMRGLFSRLGKTRLPLLMIAVATLTLVIPGLAIPTLSKIFVDDVLIPRSESMVVGLLIGLGTAAILSGFLVWIQQICLARMETKLSLVMTSHFFWHVMSLPMTFFDQRFAGDIASRVASNDKVAQIISGELATNAINMLTMVVYAGVMLSYDVQLTLIVFAAVLFNLAALRFVARAREDGNRRLLKEEGKVAGTSVAGLHMIETLKASGMEGDLFTRWAGMKANALAAQQELGLYTNLLHVVPPLLSSLTTVAILGAGGLRILEGALTIGGLVAFQALARSFTQPIDGLVRFGAHLQTVKGDIARLDDVLNYVPDKRSAHALTDMSIRELPLPHGFIIMRGVTFGYNAQEPPLIEGVSLAVRPGQRIAFVGGSGSGKSTLAKLIAGLLTPWSGTIKIDGRPVTEIPPSQLCTLVSYVDQDVVLFEGTVQDNVTLGNPAVDERSITLALRDAAIHDVVTARPDKYKTSVEENGRNFSGGQRQRLEIARALVTNPPVLVMDEATAALDPVTEVEIDDNLRQRGCTCIMVAHRLSTIRDADEIIVLAGGKIVQRGTHDRLIREAGVYRDLISSA